MHCIALHCIALHCITLHQYYYYYITTYTYMCVCIYIYICIQSIFSTKKKVVSVNMVVLKPLTLGVRPVRVQYHIFHVASEARRFAFEIQGHPAKRAN